MPNKTIYVSDVDVPLFEEAKQLAGDTLSSIISIALREYVTKMRQNSVEMRDVSLPVGSYASEVEKRFVGTKLYEWRGFNDAREFWMEGEIYRTQKNNWVVYLTTICKATLLTNRKKWREDGDHLVNVRKSELIVGAEIAEFEGKIPHELYEILKTQMRQAEKSVVYLDI